jgi:hypothetical protein
MLSSIQDYARNINSRLSWVDVASVLILTIFLAFLALFLYFKKERGSALPTYIASNGQGEGEVRGTFSDARPFASIHGKTYTFSWCNGSSNISAKNKIYFTNEEGAQATGRTLSKLCQK